MSNRIFFVWFVLSSHIHCQVNLFRGTHALSGDVRLPDLNDLVEPEILSPTPRQRLRAESEQTSRHLISNTVGYRPASRLPETGRLFSSVPESHSSTKATIPWWQSTLTTVSQGGGDPSISSPEELHPTNQWQRDTTPETASIALQSRPRATDVEPGKVSEVKNTKLYNAAWFDLNLEFHPGSDTSKKEMQAEGSGSWSSRPNSRTSGVQSTSSTDSTLASPVRQARLGSLGDGWIIRSSKQDAAHLVQSETPATKVRHEGFVVSPSFSANHYPFLGGRGPPSVPYEGGSRLRVDSIFDLLSPTLERSLEGTRPNSRAAHNTREWAEEQITSIGSHPSKKARPSAASSLDLNVEYQPEHDETLPEALSVSSGVSLLPAHPVTMRQWAVFGKERHRNDQLLRFDWPFYDSNVIASLPQRDAAAGLSRAPDEFASSTSGRSWIKEDYLARWDGLMTRRQSSLHFRDSERFDEISVTRPLQLTLRRDESTQNRIYRTFIKEFLALDKTLQLPDLKTFAKGIGFRALDRLSTSRRSPYSDQLTLVRQSHETDERFNNRKLVELCFVFTTYSHSTRPDWLSSLRAFDRYSQDGLLFRIVLLGESKKFLEEIDLYKNIEEFFTPPERAKGRAKSKSGPNMSASEANSYHSTLIFLFGTVLMHQTLEIWDEYSWLNVKKDVSESWRNLKNFWEVSFPIFKRGITASETDAKGQEQDYFSLDATTSTREQSWKSTAHSASSQRAYRWVKSLMASWIKFKLKNSSSSRSLSEITLARMDGIVTYLQDCSMMLWYHREIDT